MKDKETEETELQVVSDNESKKEKKKKNKKEPVANVDVVVEDGIEPNGDEQKPQIKKKMSWREKRKLKKKNKYQFKEDAQILGGRSFMEVNKTNEGQEILNNKPPPAGGLKRLTFAPAGSLVYTGTQRVIKQSDLWGIPKDFQSQHIFKRFTYYWDRELKKPKPSFTKAIMMTFWKDWLMAMSFQIIYAVFQFITPIILPHLIEFIADPSKEYWKGYVYTAIVFAVTVCSSFFYFHSWFLSGTIGIRIRACMILSIYSKILTIGSSKSANSGQVVNLVGNDSQFISDTIPGFTTGMVAPVQVIVATILMWQHVGPYALLAIGCLLLFFPLSAFLGKRFGTFRLAIQAAADKRLKLTNELLSGIRIVKFYAWEGAFIKNIFAQRELELLQILGLSNNRAILIFILSNTTTIVLALIFLFYGFYGPSVLTVSKAFSVLSVMNLLKLPFFLLPFTVTLVAQYTATFQRIQAYITKPDISDAVADEPVNSGNVLELEDADFKWDPEVELPTLSGINLKVKQGQIIMVVGQVGSGKSSLAATILGDIPQLKGNRRLRGKIALVPQEPWIVNATVQENILFGEKFDEDRYIEVIEACALEPDLNQLPFGDQTEIGERGITLSGGQKQRVSIARALYSMDKDFYIMDDPFSAVDSHVGKHLFEEAVQKYCKGKTVFLVTNQLQYLPYADQVVLINNHTAEAIGTYDELNKTSEHFRTLMKAFGQMEEVKKPKEGEEKKEEVEVDASSPKLNKKTAASFRQTAVKEKIETKETGLVSWRVYWFYIKSGGAFLFFGILLCLGLSAGSTITSAWWLTKWTGAQYPGAQWFGKPVGFFIGIYVAFLAGQAIFNYFAYLIFSYFGTQAARVLHANMLRIVSRAPTSFFDVTPLGRIINRFAKEMSLVDALLPMQLSQYLFSVFTLLSVFAAMIFASTYIIIAIVPVLIFYVIFQLKYRHTSVEIQRMEALSRAPIFSHLGETIHGVSTIRSYKMQTTFQNMNAYRLDFNTTQLFAMRYCATWFGLVLDLVGEFLVAIVYMAICLTRNYSYGSLDVGYAALAITYTSGLTFVLSNLNLMAVETETRMNSVERIKEYNDLPQEKDDIIEGSRPPANWPTEGKIEFKDYCFGYKKDELVLKNINATVNDKEKVGIVGRTGAGKSSLMQALFRFSEPASGTIFIDGVDITKIGLRDLRTKLSLIPQDPTLFIGSVRYNLDPFNEQTDEALWNSLKMVKLDEAISALPGKLDELIAERGANFSVGQRQMICMARALLRSTKVLLMDEATASVDLKTDTLIQKMVRKNFKDVTVLTIAHRLNTIMDSSKVMVLNRGELIEYDHPSKLLDKPDGILTGMVEATGPLSAKYLKKIANGELGVMDVMKSIDVNPNETGNDADNIPSPKMKKAKKEKRSKKEKKSKKSKKEKKEREEESTDKQED